MTITTGRKNRVMGIVVATVCGALVILVGAELVRTMPAYSDYKANVAKAGHHELTPVSVDPSWIISGSPVFRVNVFERTPHVSTLSGIWECAGPAKFVWHYGVDESIYILEGSVEVEYLGKKITLGPGDSTEFIAGTTATWTVAERVRKTYRIQNPGRFVRVMRRIFS